MNLHRLTRQEFQAALSAFCAGWLAARSEAPGREAPRNDEALGPGASLRGVQVFPRDDPWNENIAAHPVDSLSGRILERIGLDKPLHPDFGTVYQGRPNGIPYVVVPGTQPKVPVRFDYPDESDPGPYPIPRDAPIERGSDAEGDRHILVIDRDGRRLYELFAARPDPGGNGWKVGSGAIFDFRSNRLRPAGWTSADAAGLPVFSGLVRHDEVVGQGGCPPRLSVHREEVSPGLRASRPPLCQPSDRRRSASNGDASPAQAGFGQ